MHKLIRITCTLCLVALALPALAADTSTPVGTWKQVDDNTGKVTSILKITNHDGELRAHVLKVLNQSPENIARDGTPPICTQCEGERHNQPIEGMLIMWGVHQDGDEWNGGHILDPGNGKTYKVKLELANQGNTLEVRGYIGFSLFGRTQEWQRMPEPPAAKPAPATSAPAPAPAASVPASAQSAATPATSGSVRSVSD